MKTLTLHAPWAWAIIFAGKDIENRTWKPPPALIGQRLAIHAGANLGDLEARETCAALCRAAGFEPPTVWPTSVILGTVLVTGCVSTDSSPWFFGPCGWTLAHPIALSAPLVAKGRLGVWECGAIR